MQFGSKFISMAEPLASDCFLRPESGFVWEETPPGGSWGGWARAGELRRWFFEKRVQGCWERKGFCALLPREVSTTPCASSLQTSTTFWLSQQVGTCAEAATCCWGAEAGSAQQLTSLPS